MTGWAEVSVSVPGDCVAGVESALEEQGALAVTLLDNADQPVLEPSPGTTPLWPIVQIHGLFPASVKRAEVSLLLLNTPGIARPDALSWHDVIDQDWERAWMDRFQPMCFGKSLWIVPSGMEAPEDKQALVLHLDPGLAFGTGTHPTTALCLQWIDTQKFVGRKVLDFGCGSGVLGIACALKGAQSVTCVDNDPQALEATGMNASRNNVSHLITCQAPEGFGRARLDVVLANILAKPLIDLKSVLLNYLVPGGQIVLSGILEDQVDEVAQVYADRCGELKVDIQDGWARLWGVSQ